MPGVVRDWRVELVETHPDLFHPVGDRHQHKAGPKLAMAAGATCLCAPAIDPSRFAASACRRLPAAQARANGRLHTVRVMEPSTPRVVTVRR
jgi:hypothetical protein